MDTIKELAVSINIKTCSIEKCSNPLLKRFMHPDYKDGIVIRDIAGIVTNGKKKFKAINTVLVSSSLQPITFIIQLLYQ